MWAEQDRVGLAAVVLVVCITITRSSLSEAGYAS